MTNEVFTSRKYTQILAEGNEAIEWLSGLGSMADVQPRFLKYIQIITEFLDARSVGNQRAFLGERTYELSNAFSEISMLITIYKGLGTLPDYRAALIKRLSLLTKGPEFVSEETTSTNEARNTAFEVYLTACCIASGFNLSPSVADLEIDDGDLNLFIECKRPYYAHTLVKNIDRAFGQLTTRYDNSTHPGTKKRGIIALSINRIVGSDEKFLVAKDPTDLNNQLNLKLAEFIFNNESHWKNSRDSRTIGVLLHISTIASLEEPNCVTICNHIMLNNIGDEGMDDLTNLLNRLQVNI